MTDNDTIQELQHRVEQLEEQQEQLVQGAIDAQGRNWSVSDFLSMGLSRRQALTAVAAIASGATIGGALREAVGVASAAASTSDSDGDVGTPSSRVDVFADAVDTDQVSFVNFSGGATKELLDYNASANQQGGLGVQYTDGVSTTSTAIYSGGSSDSEVGFMLFVSGADVNSTTTGFSDLVLMRSFGEAKVVGSAVRGTPATRTYAKNQRTLELTMGSSTYNVAVTAIEQFNKR